MPWRVGGCVGVYCRDGWRQFALSVSCGRAHRWLTILCRDGHRTITPRSIGRGWLFSGCRLREPSCGRDGIFACMNWAGTHTGPHAYGMRDRKVPKSTGGSPVCLNRLRTWGGMPVTVPESIRVLPGRLNRPRTWGRFVTTVSISTGSGVGRRTWLGTSGRRVRTVPMARGGSGVRGDGRRVRPSSPSLRQILVRWSRPANGGDG